MIPCNYLETIKRVANGQDDAFIEMLSNNESTSLHSTLLACEAHTLRNAITDVLALTSEFSPTLFNLTVRNNPVTEENEILPLVNIDKFMQLLIDRDCIMNYRIEVVRAEDNFIAHGTSQPITFEKQKVCLQNNIVGAFLEIQLDEHTWNNWTIATEEVESIVNDWEKKVFGYAKTLGGKDKIVELALFLRATKTLNVIAHIQEESLTTLFNDTAMFYNDLFSMFNDSKKEALAPCAKSSNVCQTEESSLETLLRTLTETDKNIVVRNMAEDKPSTSFGIPNNINDIGIGDW